MCGDYLRILRILHILRLLLIGILLRATEVSTIISIFLLIKVPDALPGRGQGNNEREALGDQLILVDPHLRLIVRPPLLPQVGARPEFQIFTNCKIWIKTCSVPKETNVGPPLVVSSGPWDPLRLCGSRPGLFLLEDCIHKLTAFTSSSRRNIPVPHGVPKALRAKGRPLSRPPGPRAP